MEKFTYVKFKSKAFRWFIVNVCNGNGIDDAKVLETQVFSTFENGMKKAIELSNLINNKQYGKQQETSR